MLSAVHLVELDLASSRAHGGKLGLFDGECATISQDQLARLKRLVDDRLAKKVENDD
jgi:hypothetical protein